MKNKNRLWILPFIVIGCLIMLTTSCKKDDADPDYTSQIEGTYVGTVSVNGSGSVSCTTTINKSSGTVVTVTIIVGSSSVPPSPGMTVKTSGGIYTFSYTDASGSFTGRVDGNTLTWTIISGSTTEIFTGTK